MSLALALLLAAAPPKALPLEPLKDAGVALSLVRGSLQLRGDKAHGLAKVKRPELDQLAEWSAPQLTLQARAEHERSLLQRAADGESPGDVQIDKEFARAASPGQGALSFTARIEKTHFRITVVDCADQQVLLSTFGADAALVQATHQAALRTLVCAAKAAPGR